MLESAGFEIESSTSRSYRFGSKRLEEIAFRSLWWLNDALVRLVSGRRVERGSYVFIRARKRGPVMRRYPRAFYFDRETFPEWYAANSADVDGRMQS
jgi:hypothetical protein